MLLCGDVFEVLKSQKLGSMSNAPDQLRTPIQNQGRAKAGVHQVFTNMTQGMFIKPLQVIRLTFSAQKAEWVRIFVEAVEGLPHERSSHFADRMVAGHWLLNKLEDKLNVVFIATEAFQKILDKALNMLRARGRIGFPGKRGTKELTLTHATNVDMEEAPAHAKTNDEMTERLVRYQVALDYQTGRADAYQEIIRRLLEKPRIDANVLDDFAPPNSPGIPGNDKTESANKSSKVSTPSTTFLAKLKVPFASASGIPSNNKTESAINRSKFSTPSATLLEDEPIIFASPLKAPSSPSDDSTESETSSFCRVRQQNVEETRWALEGQYTHEEYNDMESSEAGSHVSKRRSL
ncbi:hypothetical protein IWX50DRAFT_618890 [Phyllosticta citricarpa]